MRATRLPHEFHVSRAMRERCRFDELLFASSGHAVLARPEAAHRFVAALDAARPGSPPSSAAELFALGLLDEAMHLVIAHWRRLHEPTAFAEALVRLERSLGADATRTLLRTFLEQFPPVAVHRGELTAEAWLAGATDGRPHADVALEELLLLSLEDANPAVGHYRELFDTAPLEATTIYAAALRDVEAFLATRTRLGEHALPLLEFLRTPYRAAPHSLLAQLEYVRLAWAPWLGDLIERMQLAFDLREEEARWLAARAAAARGDHAHGEETGFPDLAALEGEHERFSPDAEWMPRSVMLAKSTLVWLDQLSRKYGRAITRLDHVPDEELDRFAAFGINALWLIGVWERSEASRRIKQFSGNPDAAASAYAVHDYVIAAELGGDDGWRDLRDRAAARGIRLASDMVPNHMGLDSRWVVEHPEWFLARRDCPYPSYSFEGPELSSDGRVSLKIEDHYWTRSDAAVVFRRTDTATGDTRFIYHGNDGTSFPWNDTAQLDYLNPDAREAVMQAILAIARRFPIIRFDAAMTLARRHIQRLWFPEPGSGGAIPSRAGHGFTRAQFDRVMPREFWRDVVDRVAQEAPGTLLLAEAFWLMEGYFVRTLGMHRVYNSAFMVMLRDERNADFRRVLRDTLEFDPGILQRWVNFLNNPDERTAVDQFGRGEKYFGACTLLATLPGLPMFGHGQLEGFEERYGMEFRRALRDEPVDEGLEREHWRRIAPLLHVRSRFSGADQFLLFDCRDPSGHVNEDVFAYTNRDSSGAALVLFHNRWGDARGRIRWSAAYAEKRPDGSRPMRQRTLLEGLGLAHAPDDALLRCRDLVSGFEHLLYTRELREHGLRVELGPFGSRVLLDWHEVTRDGRPWDELARELGGHGVQDLERALWEHAVRPAQQIVAEAIARSRERGDAPLLAALSALTAEASARLTWVAADPPVAAARLRDRLARWEREAGEARPPREASVGPTSRASVPSGPKIPSEPAPSGPVPAVETAAGHAAHAAWLLLEACGAAFDPADPARRGRRMFDELLLREPIANALRQPGVEGDHAWRLAARVRALLAHGRAAEGGVHWQAFLADDDARFAAGLEPGEAPKAPPAWLELPARLERTAPRAARRTD